MTRVMLMTFFGQKTLGGSRGERSDGRKHRGRIRTRRPR